MSAVAAAPLFDDAGSLFADRLYTRRETASILSVSTPTLERWAAEGAGPRVTRLYPRSRPFYRGSDIRAALDRSAE